VCRTKGDIGLMCDIFRPLTFCRCGYGMFGIRGISFFWFLSSKEEFLEVRSARKPEVSSLGASEPLSMVHATGCLENLIKNT
jgi:hypothetical protein